METTNPHETRAQFGARYTPLIRKSFKKISEGTPEMTVQQIVEHLCEFYQQNAVELHRAQDTVIELTEKVQTLENQLQELQTENANLSDAAQSSADNNDAELQSLREQIETLEAKAGTDAETISELTAQNERAIADYERAQQMANANAQELTKMTLASANPEKGKYLVEFGDVAREIMDLTLLRLREKLNKPDLTASILLTDLFVKYTKVRNHFGSFPTMVTGEEIRMIMKKYE